MQTINTGVLLLLTVLLVASCTSQPPKQPKATNSAQSQKDNARQAQSELSSETSK